MIKKDDLTIFPNPASDYITINSPFVSKYEVLIYTTLGNCVPHTPSFLSNIPPLNGGNIRIDVSHLPVEVYFIRIGTAMGMFVRM